MAKSETPEPLPGMLAGLQSLQAANFRALREGEGRGLTTRQMAQHLERESGYRDLVEALDGMLNENPPFRIGFAHTDLCTQVENCGCAIANARKALAKARGEKPDAQFHKCPTCEWKWRVGAEPKHAPGCPATPLRGEKAR